MKTFLLGLVLAGVGMAQDPQEPVCREVVLPLAQKVIDVQGTTIDTQATTIKLLLDIISSLRSGEKIVSRGEIILNPISYSQHLNK